MIGHRWRRLVSLFILSAAAAGAEPLADPGAPLAGMVALYNTDRARLGVGRFPLENAATDTVRVRDGLQRNVDTYIRQQKRQLGGSWLRVVQDASTGAWRLDRTRPTGATTPPAPPACG